MRPRPQQRDSSLWSQVQFAFFITPGAGKLRENTGNAKQFTLIATELAQLNVDQTLALRAAEATARQSSNQSQTLATE